MIVATTPHFDEPQDLLDEASASVLFDHYVYEAELGAPGFPNESSLRRPGLAEAIRRGADWWLQLDADEQLARGSSLAERVAGLSPAVMAYPLPRLEEDGAVQVCPYKLVRLPVELVVGCDHFRRPGDDRVWRYSLDRSAAENDHASLLAGPHLIHRPSRRPRSRRTIRVGELENVAEPRPHHAVPVRWADTLRGGGPMAHEHSQGTYYCPGCGLRYATAGTCTGSAESGHEPIEVERVSGKEPAAKKPAVKKPAARTRKAPAAKK